MRREPEMASRRSTLGVVVGAASLALTAACGPSSKGGSSGGGSSGDVAGAQASVDKLLQPPTSIGNLPPLTKPAVSGKKMIITETPEPVTIKVNDGMAAAAQAVGWQVTRIAIGTGAEDPAKALS